MIFVGNNKKNKYFTAASFSASWFFMIKNGKLTNLGDRSAWGFTAEVVPQVVSPFG